MEFKNYSVLISGGTRGIGYATANLFKLEGADVIILGRNREQGRIAAHELGVTYIECDVRIIDDCQKAIKACLEQYGHLDILVNGAGIIFRNRNVEQTSEDEWNLTFDTNVKGAFMLSKFAIPSLRQSKGTIINISSYVGLVGFQGASAYAASKAALVNLTHSMALDYAKEGIRVNCVCPGSVATDMIYEAWRLYGNEEEAKQIWAAKHPIGRIARPEEVAQGILFLASKKSSFITGVALPIDGGITAA